MFGKHGKAYDILLLWEAPSRHLAGTQPHIYHGFRKFNCWHYPNQHGNAQLGGQLSGVTDYTVPETDVVHRIVSIEKTQHTPKQFPRAFARIKKAPLV